MLVMPGVIGQVGQNVADNLFELGKSAVKGTAGALTDIASESIEQLSGAAPQASQTQKGGEQQGLSAAAKEEKRRQEKQRFEEVRAELTQYMRRKKELDQRIAHDKEVERRQVEQKKEEQRVKKESCVKRLINRAATSTEKGRSSE